nr:reverse transcriptase zinc-binding domain-containing protein [Tanacetum cinerariifolium]
MGAINSIITLLLLVIFVSSIAVNNAQCGGGTVNCDGGQTCCQGGFNCCRGGSFCCPRGRTCSNPPGRCFQDRKGIDVDSLLCLICKAHVENVDHLFFSCEMAHDLWGLLARWCNLDTPEVSNITEWFSWLDDAHVSKSARV